MELNVAIMGILGKTTTSRMIKAVCESKTPVINEINDVKSIQEDKFYNNDIYIFLNSYNSPDINEEMKKLVKYVSKSRLFIANADDKILLEILATNNSTPIITFGLNSKSTITASSLSYTKEAIRFTYCLQRSIMTFSGKIIEPFEHPFELKLMGIFHVYDALAAITVAMFMDEDVCVVKKALKKLMIKHDMELVYDGDFTIIDSRCTNLYSFEKILESLQFIDYNSLIVVCQLTDNAHLDNQIRKTIANWRDTLDIKKVIFVSTREINNKEEVFFNNMKDSLKCAISSALKNDIILLMGNKVEHGLGEAIFDSLYSC